MKPGDNFLEKSIFILLFLVAGCFNPAFSTEPLKGDYKLIEASHDGLAIKITKVFAWRDWQPIVSRSGNDGGSPLLLVAGFSLRNSTPRSRKVHWEAFLRQTGKAEIIPVELWDANSKHPWSGEINADAEINVALRTSSGPYLAVGSEIALIMKFSVDGEEVIIQSKPVKIMRTD